MSITNTLPGLPLVSQLNEPSGDPYPDNNRNWNCVPASIAAGLMYLLKPRMFYGDSLKDAVYGASYTGAQAPAQYVAYLAGLGITLTPYSGSQSAMVAHIHSELAAGRPVVVTIPSQWGTPPPNPIHPSGSTHVVCMAGWGPGWLRAVNPWGGFWQDATDAWWAARLCYGQIWTLAHKGGSEAMSWMKQTDGTGKDAHGHTCGAGDMAYLLAHALAGNDGLMSETPYDGPDTFLPLTSGQIVTATRDAHGSWTIGEQGAQALVSVWQQLQVAKAGDTPPADPLATKALAQLTGLKAFLGEL